MRRLLSVVFLSLLAVSCTFNEPRIRPATIATYPQAGRWNWQTYPDPSISKSDIRYQCVETPSNWDFAHWVGRLFSGTTSNSAACIYLTALPDTIDMPKMPKHGAECTEYDEYAETISRQADDLIYHSDYNCNNFLARVFALKANVGFAGGVLSALLSATATVITPAAGIPALVPTGISGGNTFLSSSMAQFNSNYFADKSFDVMEAGILAKRQLVRSEINAGLCETFRRANKRKKNSCDAGAAGAPPKDPAASSDGKSQDDSKSEDAKSADSSKPQDDCVLPSRGSFDGYTPMAYWNMAEAMSDVIAYDRVCSIEGGISELSQAAAKSQQEADSAAGAGTPTPSATPAPQATPTATPTPKPPVAGGGKQGKKRL